MNENPPTTPTCKAPQLDAFGRKHNILILSRMRGYFKADMVFEFDRDGTPVDAEMSDIEAESLDEAARKAKEKWGWSILSRIVPDFPSPTEHSGQAEFQAWGGPAGFKDQFQKRPESDFPRNRRFVVTATVTFLLTTGDWSLPQKDRRFYLADDKQDALDAGRAHYATWDETQHRASEIKVEACPEVAAYFDTCCRFDGKADIRYSKRRTV